MLSANPSPPASGSEGVLLASAVGPGQSLGKFLIGSYWNLKIASVQSLQCKMMAFVNSPLTIDHAVGPPRPNGIKQCAVFIDYSNFMSIPGVMSVLSILLN